MKIKKIFVQTLDNYRDEKRRNAKFEKQRKRVTNYLANLPQPELTEEEK